MAHQEEEARRSRVVVNTPTSQREVVRSEAVKYPEREGVSGGVLAAIVVGVVALAAIAVLFLMNRQQQDANANVASQPPQTTIVQQPAQQPPVVVQPPAPATQPAPVIFNNPPASTGTATSGASNDSSIQAAIDKKLSNDPNLSSLGIYATVVNGKATITGTVRSEAVKAQVERAVRSVKGVKSVDNQIIIG
ncbi:MAG: hypothetical protein DMF71_08580 [Acidobacteria bacterium]|nr:MAG: hypothetical protein DMF71_08580 [Acidobacteriota bacterium]